MNNKLTWQLGGMGWFVHKQFTHVRYVRTTLCVSSQTTLNYEGTLPFMCASKNKSTEKSSINAVTHTPFASLPLASHRRHTSHGDTVVVHTLWSDVMSACVCARWHILIESRKTFMVLRRMRGPGWRTKSRYTTSCIMACEKTFKSDLIPYQ